MESIAGRSNEEDYVNLYVTYNRPTEREKKTADPQLA
jgi:hypothetical protein